MTGLRAAEERREPDHMESVVAELCSHARLRDLRDLCATQGGRISKTTFTVGVVGSIDSQMPTPCLLPLYMRVGDWSINLEDWGGSHSILAQELARRGVSLSELQDLFAEVDLANIVVLTLPPGANDRAN